MFIFGFLGTYQIDPIPFLRNWLILRLDHLLDVMLETVELLLLCHIFLEFEDFATLCTSGATGISLREREETISSRFHV